MSLPASVTNWNCPACTLENDAKSVKCSMCDTSKYTTRSGRKVPQTQFMLQQYNLATVASTKRGRKAQVPTDNKLVNVNASVKHNEPQKRDQKVKPRMAVQPARIGQGVHKKATKIVTKCQPIKAPSKGPTIPSTSSSSQVSSREPPRRHYPRLANISRENTVITEVNVNNVRVIITEYVQ